MAEHIPSEAPPSYAQATGSSVSSSQPAASSSSNANASSRLEVPGASNHGKGGIPDSYRRSMEDEMRPLPQGWVRTFDPQSQHQFFVDTTKDPPRSIWVHPYDDDEYMRSLSGEQRERIEQETIEWRKRHHHPSKEDYVHAHSDDEDDMLPQAYTSTPASHQELPPRPDGQDKGKGKDRSFGRKLKDKMTGMTHEEREQERRERAAEEQRMYEMHVRVRDAMQRAMQTGQPQWLGKDRDGKDVYIEPPRPPYAGGYPYRGGYGYSPYHQGIYTTPSARYIRPQMPYGRPYGGGYGGGYGMPLALGGGLLGGAVLGSLMF